VTKGLSITVLVENTANQGGLLAGHGLTFWIEAGGRRILFDTGQGMALAHNADKLGIDLSTVDDVVLTAHWRAREHVCWDSNGRM
jgi:7,8-dihydropterin-6-yl-methyl-4-(beta-D-ribofuranosyl)aminobenzene 5'-phosphate synthase